MRSFDDIIKKELDKHIPYRIEELSTKNFMPSIYQILASELSFYKGTFYSPVQFSTNSFRQAYQYEDRNEIIDELVCELRNRICHYLNVNYIKFGLRLTFITHNQWMISYYSGE